MSLMVSSLILRKQLGCVHVRRMKIAHCGESLSHAATQGLEKGVCHFGDSNLGFAQGGFSVVVAGVGVEIFLFETGGDIGIVHLDELKVSGEGFAYVGVFVGVSHIETVVSEVVVSCKHFKKNTCVTDKGEQCITGLFKNPCPCPSSIS